MSDNRMEVEFFFFFFFFLHSPFSCPEDPTLEQLVIVLYLHETCYCSTQHIIVFFLWMWGSYTLRPERFPRIEEASGNVSEHHTSRSTWPRSRTGGILLRLRMFCSVFFSHDVSDSANSFPSHMYLDAYCQKVYIYVSLTATDVLLSKGNKWVSLEIVTPLAHWQICPQFQGVSKIYSTNCSFRWFALPPKSHYPPANHHASHFKKCPISRS